MEKNLSFVLGAIALVLLLVVIYQNFDISAIVGGTGFISKDEAGEKVIDFIKENLTSPGTEISLTEINEMSGVYEVKFNIMGQDEKVHVTKDTKLLFLQSFDMQPSKPKELPKTEKPKVDLFVMSFCPYGNQAEELMMPVADLLGDSAEIELHYIVYSDYGSGYPEDCIDQENKYCSLHAIGELNQGIRELCVAKYQSDKFWNFVKQTNAQATSDDIETKWQGIASSLDVDVNMVSNCQQNEGIALLDNELALTDTLYPVQDPAEHNGQEEMNVSGSPTIVINGMVFDGQRSVNAYREAICSAFIEPPVECEEELIEPAPSSEGSCE